MEHVEMWYERHLRMRKDQPAIIRFLLWIGLVKFGRKDFSRYDAPEVIRWPVKVAPWCYWQTPIRTARCWGWFYLFRNQPGVINRLPGRLLPARWGFGIMGLIEIGDRG